MNKKNIHFIVNPIAGSGNSTITYDYLLSYFNDEKYILNVKYSDHKKHAVQLTKDSINDGANIVVACGGDGTINEIASCLVDTSIPLGIIPIGSGNGLASNLEIPKKIEDAISVIKNQHIIGIDVGGLNKKYFFSNTGFGFDARVIKNYEKSKTRTITSYIKASLKSFKEFNNKKEIEIIINDNIVITNPFLIFISNSNELGYNMSFTPKASLQDGLLDIVIVPQLNKFKMLLFGLLTLFKKQHLLKDVKSYQANSIKLKKEKGKKFESQIDGEFKKIQKRKISIFIKKEALNVIVNNF